MFLSKDNKIHKVIKGYSLDVSYDTDLGTRLVRLQGKGIDISFTFYYDFYSIDRVTSDMELVSKDIIRFLSDDNQVNLQFDYKSLVYSSYVSATGGITFFYNYIGELLFISDSKDLVKYDVISRCMYIYESDLIYIADTEINRRMFKMVGLVRDNNTVTELPYKRYYKGYTCLKDGIFENTFKDSYYDLFNGIRLNNYLLKIDDKNIYLRDFRLDSSYEVYDFAINNYFIDNTFNFLKKGKTHLKIYFENVVNLFIEIRSVQIFTTIDGVLFVFDATTGDLLFISRRYTTSQESTSIAIFTNSIKVWGRFYCLKGLEENLIEPQDFKYKLIEGSFKRRNCYISLDSLRKEV